MLDRYENNDHYERFVIKVFKEQKDYRSDHPHR